MAKQGTDVTHLLSMLKGAPARIETQDDEVVINGECVTDNDVDNYRNYVSGALGLDSLQEFIDRNIKFIAHDWLGVTMNYTTRMKVVKNMGFLLYLMMTLGIILEMVLYIVQIRGIENKVLDGHQNIQDSL